MSSGRAVKIGTDSACFSPEGQKGTALEAAAHPSSFNRLQLILAFGADGVPSMVAILCELVTTKVLIKV